MHSWYRSDNNTHRKAHLYIHIAVKKIQIWIHVNFDDCLFSIKITLNANCIELIL